MNSLFPHPLAANYQHEPQKVAQAIMFLEQKAREAKSIIESLLSLLDSQEKALWKDLLERFASLASLMSNIESALKKSGLQASSTEDHGALLRTHVIVPQRLQQEPDEELYRITNNRLISWNHDIVPEYLRTKMNPDLENEENAIDVERNSKGTELIGRQIQTINKHVDALMQTIPATEKPNEMLDKITYNREDTIRLVRAIMQGDGLRQPRIPSMAQGPPMMPGSVPQQMPPRPPTVQPQYR